MKQFSNNSRKKFANAWLNKTRDLSKSIKCPHLYKIKAKLKLNLHNQQNKKTTGVPMNV